MKRSARSRWGFSLALLVSFFPATVRADQQADDLYAQYKAAMAKNQVEQAVEYLCSAAKLDTQKYGKSCDSAQQYVASRLQKYDGLFVTGKSEFESKDYVGAIRDLSKIDFGPKREEAQKLIGQANDLINHPQPVDTSAQSLKAAQTAYDNGDFATAAANAGLVKAADLQPQAQVILSNIKNYNDNVQQGDALVSDKNYAAAQQKYNAALSIKSNGPGNPSGKLQQIAGLMAAAKPNTTAVAINKSGTSSSTDNTAKIKADLAAAQDAAAKGNWQAALAEYDQALTLDPKQQEAITGKGQAQDAIKAALSKDPKALEDTLIGGIRSYYESHFLEARDALTLYLTAGGTRSKGAAYFYLGAAMLAQAFVSDPKSKDDQDRLQQSALQQFQQAKQVRYRPAEKYISPKILAIWNQPGM
jgi:hypothetical protein